MTKSDDTISDRFVLEELIGQGGVGEVWRARGSKKQDRKFAIKMLRPEYLGNPKLRRRFTREARASMKLSHSNIAGVYAFGVDDSPYIAMELIEGPTLNEAIQVGLSVRNIIKLGIQLAGGLAHAHARGVVHRDLKPDNLLLSKSSLPKKIGTVKIVDFGIATLDDYIGGERETQVGEVVGTPRYMSPEQAIGESILGPRSDMYSLGLLLYELIVGERPYLETSGLAVMSKHVHDPIPKIVPRKGIQIPESLEHVVMRALEKKPANRWNSCGQMREELEKIQSEIADEKKYRIHPSEDLTPNELRANRITQEATGLQGSRLKKATDSSIVDHWKQEIPFTGRGKERDQLRFYADKARHKDVGSIIFLEGEAGVGKSRIANWYKQTLEEEGAFRTHSGTFSPDVRGLGGAREVLASMFRTTGLPDEKVSAKVQQRLSAWGHESAKDIKTLVNFLRPSETFDAFEDKKNRSELFALVIRIFEMASERMPRLLFFDDVHWAGQGLFEFFDILVSEITARALRIVIVCTIRTEDLVERPNIVERLELLRKYPVVHRINVARLEQHDGIELVQAILPSEPELVDIVLERSSGNPLHLIMLLRYLREEKLLEWKEGRWCASDINAIKGTVPPSLGELFQERLRQAESHTDGESRLEKVLQIAAFAGARFRYDVVRRMLKDKSLISIFGQGPNVSFSTLQNSFDLDLGLLVAEGFLVEIPGSAQEWYGFSHRLLCDFIVQNTSPEMAKSLHRSAAIAYAAADDARTFSYEIAEHFLACGDEDNALFWYKGAGDDSLQRFELYRSSTAFEAVLKILDRKLGIESSTAVPLGNTVILAELGEKDVDPAIYLEVLSRLGDLYEGFGNFPMAERGYRRVVRIIAQTKNLPEELVRPFGYSWLGLGHIAWQRGDFEAAEWAFKKVREIVNTYTDQIILDVEAVRGLARVFWYRGEYSAAKALAEEAYSIAKGIDDVIGQAESMWILGEIFRLMGKANIAREKFELSMKLYAQESSQTGSARNMLSLAQLSRYQKDFAEARERYTRTLTSYEQLGDKRGQGQCYNGLGDIERFESRFAEAERFYAKALDLYTSIGVEYGMAVVMANLGINAMARGDFGAAKDYLSSAADIIQSNDFPYLVDGIEYNLALAKSLGGQLGDISALLELASKTKIRDIDYAQPLERLANLYASKGKLNEAKALWKRAKEMYEDLDLAVDSRRVETYLQDS